MYFITWLLFFFFSQPRCIEAQIKLNYNKMINIVDSYNLLNRYFNNVGFKGAVLLLFLSWVLQNKKTEPH